MQLLYTSKSTKRTGNLEELFFDQEHPKLNQIDKEKCEGLLTEKECLEAVKSMELGKSPGTDGLPAEFYKVFLKDMSPFLISSLNRSYQNGKLAITQRRGVISLIPKKDKALNELRAVVSNFRESGDRAENSNFFLFAQKNPFGKLFSKIILKSSSEFLFWQKNGKFEIGLNGPSDPM